MAAGSPENTTPDDDNTNEGANNTAGLEARIGELQKLVETQGDATGQVAQLIQGFQAQLNQMTQNQAAGDDDDGEPQDASEEFKKFYANPAEYIKKYAEEANREALGPHLANQAVQTRDGLLQQAQQVLDQEHGAGFFADKISGPLSEVLKEVPLEQQASRHHIEAAIGAVMGRLYLNPDDRKELETRRSKTTKEREDAMNLLPGGRPRPARPDQLEDRHRTFLDTLERSGITMGEAEYKAAMTAGDDIDSWEAAKAAISKKK